MRYASPSIASRLEALVDARLRPHSDHAALSAIFGGDHGDGVRRGVPLSDAAAPQPALRILPPYYDDPYYIEVLASSLTAELKALPFKPDVIVASYHGMPQEYVQKGDPYESQCRRDDASCLRAQLGLRRNTS